MSKQNKITYWTSRKEDLERILLNFTGEKTFDVYDRTFRQSSITKTQSKTKFFYMNDLRNLLIGITIEENIRNISVIGKSYTKITLKQV